MSSWLGAPVAHVFELAELLPDRIRALILLAGFTSLRYGELAALRRSNVSERCESATVVSTLMELRTGELLFGPPKSDAGLRTVTIPAEIRGDIASHLATCVADDPDSLIFTGPKGGVLRPGSFHRLVSWKVTVAKAGVPAFHFHDLRHTGNTLAAGTGASLRDLMSRVGHASTRAALIYQHATRKADEVIAAALDEQIRAHRGRARSGHAAQDEDS